jgi:hypothetical protein
MKQTIFYALSLVNLLTLCLFLYSFVSKENTRESDLYYADKILKVRGIVVVDSFGIERVIIGSHLPEPNFSNGSRIAARGKGGSVSGVMLYDHEGQERGGYVTDDGAGNAFLTLDSKTNQQMLLLAEPQGGARIRLWDRNNNSINISADSKEAVIELTKNGKNIMLTEDDNK